MESMVADLTQTFLGSYKGKRVLVTGHTGFKGSWLSLWLLELGAKVAGFSAYIPTEPSHFEAANIINRVQDFRGDVRNPQDLQEVCNEFKPHIIFHLAAQPLVRESYADPKKTFDTNVSGTINVLEIVRKTSSIEALIIITSDKCYENVGWDWGYREIDRLGGEDPYSASKACAEIATNAYFQSFFNRDGIAQIATARAGNVIGGGDWALDRIVPDCIKAWSTGVQPVIRKPEATRPWQHVLEPLGGYLWLGAQLLREGSKFRGESFNFGPNSDVVKSVGELADQLGKDWDGKKWDYQPLEGDKREANLLKLSCDKALRRLQWRSIWILMIRLILLRNGINAIMKILMLLRISLFHKFINIVPKL